jgi:hypothetical protein
MKVKIAEYHFNDKNFWMMFTPGEAIDYFITDSDHWRSHGISFSIEDRNHMDKYLRQLEIWAEGPEKPLLMLIMSMENK